MLLRNNWDTDMGLTSQQIQIVDLADRAPIVQGLENVRAHWANATWLSDTNVYKDSITSRLKTDAKSRAISHDSLIEYISASTVTHCFDAWSYLGRALSAELVGDANTARHLGYYAELRAAMSLLANYGIAVLDRDHVVVDANDQCHIISGLGTHQFAWEALQHWANSPLAPNQLFSIIHPGGIPLSEWLNQYPGSASYMASYWLREWGLDISHLSTDREARNVLSYRPNAFTTSHSVSIEDIVNSVCKVWELCEPGSNGGFRVLDRYLLKKTIHTMYNKRKNGSKATDGANTKRFKQEINAMLDGVSPRELNHQQWVEFLSRAGSHIVLTDAMGKLKHTQAGHSRQVMARAFLLLRVATGATSELLKASGSLDREELRFWWTSGRVSSRLWGAGEIPEKFSDLWDDIREAKDVLTSEVASCSCLHNVWTKFSPQTALLSTTERIALWGLGL